MVYVDAYVLVVPKDKLKSYTKMAKEAGKIWKKHGAIKYVEAVGDDLDPMAGQMKQLGFPKMTNLKKNEVVFFSFITYKSKKHRDSVNAKVMKDPLMNPENLDCAKEMPFKMNRFAYGGFKSVVEY